MPRTETDTLADDSDVSDSTVIKEVAQESDYPNLVNEPRRISFSTRSMVVAGLILVLVCTTAVFAGLYIRAESSLQAHSRDASDRQKAEEVAADYAVNAANMDYQDFATWKAQLVEGTSPELNEKLTKAADQMEQVLMPLQWKSTAKPLATKVRSVSGNVYSIDSFVSVHTKTIQAPEGLQSTATYRITLDSEKDWQITDVGGIDAALAGK